jgi:hypothetical protein
MGSHVPEDAMADRQDDDRRVLDAMRQSDSEESRREAQRARDADGPPLGRGMTAADSTEAPLSTDSGEADDRALGGRDAPDVDR